MAKPTSAQIIDAVLTVYAFTSLFSTEQLQGIKLHIDTELNNRNKLFPATPNEEAFLRAMASEEGIEL